MTHVGVLDIPQLPELTSYCHLHSTEPGKPLYQHYNLLWYVKPIMLAAARHAG